MFKREHHIRIATVLQALDSEVLRRHECFFGGGTAIALTQNEYRESLDIDFLISNKEGFRDLRHMLTGARGLAPITRSGVELKLAREIRADQYGVRTMIPVGDIEIKFEIVFEGRIILQQPHSDEQICGVATLTRLDLVASKLMANSDRWSDDAVFSRDLIDLAMLRLSTKDCKAAVAKASAAYGDSILRDLNKAVDNLKSRRGRLDTCMSSLKIDDVPEAVLWGEIKNLLKRCSA